jgi:hypothetical protein
MGAFPSFEIILPPPCRQGVVNGRGIVTGLIKRIRSGGKASCVSLGRSSACVSLGKCISLFM